MSDLLDELTPPFTVAGLAPLAEAGGEERYRELVENANDIVYAHDVDVVTHGFDLTRVAGLDLRDPAVTSATS